MLEIHSLKIDSVSNGELSMECTRLVAAAGGVAAAVVTALGTAGTGSAGPSGAVPVATHLPSPAGPTASGSTVLASPPPLRGTVRSSSNRAW